MKKYDAVKRRVLEDWLHDTKEQAKADRAWLLKVVEAISTMERNHNPKIKALMEEEDV